jgi:hypothetical protein
LSGGVVAKSLQQSFDMFTRVNLEGLGKLLFERELGLGDAAERSLS